MIWLMIIDRSVALHLLSDHLFFFPCLVFGFICLSLLDLVLLVLSVVVL